MDEVQRKKRYVPVVVRFDTEGQLRPLTIEFDEEHKYPVDQVLDVCRAACQTVGGVGVRYTVRVQGQERYLWLEKDRWFVKALR
jgi:hypothetical protein